jgi:peptidoglycan hydrolase-like protein with peptidoglycan-binding domain
VTEIPVFPLPAGHCFGPGAASDLRFHDGRTNPRDGLELVKWQKAYHGLWRRPKGTVSGRYDADTQKAVKEVQTVLGVPVTGFLGATEWVAVWERVPPRKPKPEPSTRLADQPWVKKAKRKRFKDHMRKYSRWKVRPGSDPDAPFWFPGRCFGPGEDGPHVKRVQQLLGLKTTGLMNRDTVARLRGWQRANDLPVSGVVDAYQARLLEEAFNRSESP